MWDKKNIFAVVLLFLAMSLSLFEFITRDNWATRIWPFIFFIFSFLVLILIFKEFFEESKKKQL